MRLWFGILFVVLAGCIEPPPSQTVLKPDMDAQLDAEADAEDADDAGADMETPPVCDPENEMAACDRLGIECGSFVIMDQCIGLRTINCGGCDGGETCLEAGVCDNPGVNDATFCATNGFCGEVDRDGRMVDCGETCAPPETCGGVLVNRCGCRGESSAEYCSREGNPCGQYQFIDSCNVLRVANCSTCVVPQTCGGGGEDGVCGCTPQTDAQICAGLNKNCGNLTDITDNCGVTRPVVDCGMCTSPQTCGANGVQNVCVGAGCTPDSTAQFCLNLGKNCGQVSRTDNCNQNVMRTENCGTCTSPQTCGGDNIPNVCGCMPESDATFCSRNFKQCGPLTGVDNCGNPRNLTCGPCPGAETCTNLGMCCLPEDNATFCSRYNACGTTTLTDNCGSSRRVECTCANGFPCTNGTCGLALGLCMPECVSPAVCQATPTPHCCDPNGSECM